MRTAALVDSLHQDLRYAWSALRSSRTTVAIAVLTIALGTGAVTAVFSVVDRILFRDLPYPHDPDDCQAQCGCFSRRCLVQLVAGPARRLS